MSSDQSDDDQNPPIAALLELLSQFAADSPEAALVSAFQAEVVAAYPEGPEYWL